MKILITPKKLLIVDFCCAFFGGLLYLFAHSLLVGYFDLPKSIVTGQTAANFIYGIYGFIIFMISRITFKYLQFLMVMNFLYALICLVIAMTLFFIKNYLGGLILLSEFILILTLVRFERSIWTKSLA